MPTLLFFVCCSFFLKRATKQWNENKIRGAFDLNFVFMSWRWFNTQKTRPTTKQETFCIVVVIGKFCNLKLSLRAEYRCVEWQNVNLVPKSVLMWRIQLRANVFNFLSEHKFFLYFIQLTHFPYAHRETTKTKSLLSQARNVEWQETVIRFNLMLASISLHVWASCFWGLAYLLGHPNLITLRE